MADSFTFRFEVLGAPPSTNHLYEPAMRQTAQGSYVGRRKADGVEGYQSLVALAVRMSKPKGWLDEYKKRGEPQLRIRYWFSLRHDADADNILKALNDAIAFDLGVNDRSFLPTVEAKVINRKHEAKTEVEVSFIDSPG